MSFWWSHLLKVASLRTPGSCHPTRHVMGTSNSRKGHIATNFFHRLLMTPREKAGAAYKVEERVPGKVSHTCALPWLLEGRMPPQNSELLPESLGNCVDQLVRATGHTLQGEPPAETTSRLSLRFLEPFPCCGWPHCHLSSALAGKPDKTKVPEGAFDGLLRVLYLS